MTRKKRIRGRTIPFIIASFYLGGAAGWWLHASLTSEPAAVVVTTPEPMEPTTGDAPAHPIAEAGVSGPVGPAGVDSPAPEPALKIKSADPYDDLRGRHLRVPLDAADVERMKGGFAEHRGGGRAHEAVDMLAPRNTSIHAVEDGIIARLFQSKAGGTTIYQFDPSKRFCYYYAHLERYAPGLREGQAVSRGDVIGYVGTSGNAPPGTPHLHFAIFELTADQHWWEGKALDPYRVFRNETD